MYYSFCICIIYYIFKEAYYADIFITYLSGWARHGRNLPEAETSENHRNASYRYCPRTICP